MVPQNQKLHYTNIGCNHVSADVSVRYLTAIPRRIVLLLSKAPCVSCNYNNKNAAVVTVICRTTVQIFSSEYSVIKTLRYILKTL